MVIEYITMRNGYAHIYEKRCKGFPKLLIFLRVRFADLTLANFCTFHFHGTEFTLLY